MFSEFECGVCYRTFNAGRRCPRELSCKHGFCESCLRALSRPLGPGDGDEPRPAAGSLIRCPLCRRPTVLPAEEGGVRAGLRADEAVLERLRTAGLLDQEEEEEGEEAPAEEESPSSAVRGGKLRRSWRKVWRKISGGSSRSQACMSGDDLRTLAMMSSFMF